MLYLRAAARAIPNKEKENSNIIINKISIYIAKRRSGGRAILDSINIRIQTVANIIKTPFIVIYRFLPRKPETKVFTWVFFIKKTNNSAFENDFVLGGDFRTYIITAINK